MKTKKTSVPADRPQGDDTKNVIRKRLILTSAIVLALFALGAAGLNKSGTGQESPEAEETPEVQNGAYIGATIPANWLPNLRVPEGAPKRASTLSARRGSSANRTTLGTTTSLRPTSSSGRSSCRKAGLVRSRTPN